MRVNQSVLVIDSESEHSGRAGVVNRVTEGGIVVVMLDADPRRPHAEAEFREPQLKAL